MIYAFRKLLIVLIVCLCLFKANAQLPELTKTITVRDGLPQSYVSGILQDKNGFLWVSTLNGLGRYDGRGFKHYQYNAADSSSITENIILHIFDTGNDNLLICYNDGKVDVFNTETEKAVHLWKNRSYEQLKPDLSYFKSLVTTGNGICWMIGHGGGIIRIDLPKIKVTYLSPRDLNIDESVLGLAVKNKTLLLFTKTKLHACSDNGSIVDITPYPFKNISQQTHNLINIYSPAIRKNGDLLISDKTGIKAWNPPSGFYKAVPLDRSAGPGKVLGAFDSEGNYYSVLNETIYKLSPDNVLTKWSTPDGSMKGIATNICIDQSNVLWVGTNGFGLRQYNLVKTGLTGFENHNSFMIDVLSHYGVAVKSANQTFLKNSVAFANRSATIKDSVWMADVNNRHADPQFVLYYKGKIFTRTFFNKEAGWANQLCDIGFLCPDKQGVLWGIDQNYDLLKFDTHNLSYRVYAKIAAEPDEEINGMVPDDGGMFYITTNKSFFKFNSSTGVTERLTAHLPATNPMNVSADPDDKNILWIGTLAEGIVKYNKSNKSTQVFNTSTGLPNNTIYCILPGNDRLLWCSSNKGVFAFNKKTQAVISFTSKDGLFDDEFNRYYYMNLPGGDLAFGGPLGYTIFNPGKLKTDSFEPPIVLTDLNIINKTSQAIPLNDIKQLHLNYNQNFITATFAAMQFNLPEKLQYRYKLEGLDKNWIISGNENKAAYTSLPPNTYTLKLNATNTAGKWSKNVAVVKIVISPPYWQTWWFYVSVVLIVALLIYGAVMLRIQTIRNTQAQKLKFEREAMELHALALRARMNPHFIFNCLNSIKALIQQNHNKTAVSYLTTFATLIRKQLTNTGNETYLQEEIETCKLYLELEAMRFDNRIHYKFDIEDQSLLTQTKVPPLILQPIIENAIVHGLLPAEDGGTISVRVYRDDEFVICKIKDNGVGRAAAAKNKLRSKRLHESKGMSLLEERITIHNNQQNRMSFIETTDLFDTKGQPAGTMVTIKFNIEHDESNYN